MLNKQQGLVIRPFKRAHTSRHTDRELLHLTIYLQASQLGPTVRGALPLCTLPWPAHPGRGGVGVDCACCGCLPCRP